MRVVAIVALVGAFAAGTAFSATGWRVLAKGEDEGEYGSYASASVDVNKPKAIRIRATGQGIELGGYFSCQIADRDIQSGQAIVLSIAAAKSCSVSASALGDSGKLRVFIEGRK